MRRVLSLNRRNKIIAGLAAGVLVLGVGAVVVSHNWEGFFEDESGEAGEAEALPPALARHLEKLAEAIPGGGSQEGPGGAGDFALSALAYPDHDIPLARIDAARSAATKVGGRGFPSGVNKPGTWVSVGPSNSITQLTPLRDVNSYVPNEYATGGRTNALAIDSHCVAGACRMWVAPAGGGIWRTDNALAGTPKWTFLSSGFDKNAIGSITVDPNDPSGNTLYVGTGEGNACASGCVSGVGIYKTTDGGDTWTGPIGAAQFRGRGVSSIAVVPGSPGILYASSTRAVNGMSSVCCFGVNGASRIVVPGASPWGLYKSADGGATWAYIHNGAAVTCADPIVVISSNTTPCTPIGVRQVVLDPANPNIVYAASYARGVWRSTDAGVTWAQIKPSLNSSIVTTLPAIAVTTANGMTRMYVGEGHTGAGGQYSRLFRTDDATTAAPVFTDLTSSSRANPGFGSYNFCSGQCWYDNAVFIPAGHPDMVYLLGSYAYGETGGVSNGRGVLLSTDAGVSFTDQTMDATDTVHPNGLHPDEHAIVVNPANPLQFFEASDGGVMRSSGVLTSTASWCTARGLTGSTLSRCQQLLSSVPTVLTPMNKGLPTLQFLSLSVNPRDVNDFQGGTQDNGTWENYGSPVKGLQTMWGDGGQSGFDATDPAFRFHTFYDASPDVNFSSGETADWNWIADPIYGQPGNSFYVSIISDPVVSKTMFVGAGVGGGAATVLRTTTAGMGSMSLAEFRYQCNEFTGHFQVQCGDWAPLGTTALTDASWGDRAGGTVVAVKRAASDTSTLWAATNTGRVFVSHNADAASPAAVTFTRIDNLDPRSPNRYPSGISIDPANADHAFISYSGFGAPTPTKPGHVFDVTAGAGTATFADRSNDLGDVPITDVAYDNVTGDLYASSDFGVYRLAAGTATWTPAASGMPVVEVSGLTIVPGARKLYAATHGLSAWSLRLS